MSDVICTYVGKQSTLVLDINSDAYMKSTGNVYCNRINNGNYGMYKICLR